MSEPVEPQRLAGRLRALRQEGRAGSVTQVRLAAALGVSTPLISSWESGTAVPPNERLRDYARAFASERTFAGPEPVLIDEAELTDAEERRRQGLIDELGRLRDAEVRGTGAEAPGRGALGGHFWYYPDGQSVRVITTPAWPSLEKQIPYADAWHPNYIDSFHDVDRDATIELVSHIRAENPAADVRWLTADRATRNDLTKHAVILGQSGPTRVADIAAHPDSEYQANVMDYLVQRLEIPVGFRVPAAGDVEFDGEFVVTLDDQKRPRWFPLGAAADHLEVHRPRFVRDGRARALEHGLPVLEYDVALLARKRNELNRSTTVTICTGIFSRGTLGAVRALTDPALRTRNENFLIEHFGGLDDFWILFYVPIFPAAAGLETVTPDLERPFHRLRDSRTDDDRAE